MESLIPSASTITVRLRSAAVIMAAIAVVSALVPWYSRHLQIEALEAAQSGDQAASLHRAERAVLIDPLSLQARFVLAGAQQRLGRVAEARSTLTRSVAMQPLNYTTWEQLALYEKNNWGEAELSREHFAVALRLNPMDTQLLIRSKETPLPGS